MARLSRIYRQAGREMGRRLAPEYARSMRMDEMPHGGVRSVPQLEAWQLPAPRRMGKVVLASGIVERWATVAPRFDH